MINKVSGCLFDSIAELIAPDRCRDCGLPTEENLMGICRTCLAKVRGLGTPQCQKCGIPLINSAGEGHTCGACIRNPPKWDKAISVVSYDKPVTGLLHRLKYNADTTVLPALKTIVEPFRKSLELSFDLVIPVPLHIERLRKRGLNQAVYLAELLFPDRPEIIEPSLLRRTRKTAPQTGLDGIERRKNLRGAFMIDDRYTISGKQVCVVDDVFTTGTTLNECSRVLRRAGAESIYVITVARVAINH
ncbi:ComF family protein [Desulfosediminicola flagellatus]|uniref:ComF family protein n=1 Tax=Desulfosediminicola flagellatus TaxID=2569541 RepID=UPI0010AB8654|nr:ComF family protein [Desulfosediminicola flagellatus]